MAAGRRKKLRRGVIAGEQLFLLFIVFCFILNISEISDFFWAGRKTQVHRRRGSSPPFFIFGGGVQGERAEYFYR